MWKAPDGQAVKVNFDVAYRIADRESCSGFVIRDDLEFVLGSGFQINKHVVDVFSVEALAGLQALQFA